MTSVAPGTTEELSEGLTRIAGLLLSEERLESVLELVVSLTARTIPVSTGVSVTLVKNDRPATAVYSNEVTRRVDLWQYAAGEGPCLSAIKEREVQMTLDLAKDGRWPEFAVMAGKEGISAVLSLPFLPMGEPIGALNIYGANTECFNGDHVDTASLFAQQAAIVIANSVAYSSAVNTNDQLRDALDSREIIGQAKGILMERERCSAEDAFALLRSVSQRTNRKLREVAQELVDSVANSG